MTYALTVVLTMQSPDMGNWGTFGGAGNAGVETRKCRSGKYRSDNVRKAVKQKIKILNIFN